MYIALSLFSPQMNFYFGLEENENCGFNCCTDLWKTTNFLQLTYIKSMSKSVVIKI